MLNYKMLKIRKNYIFLIAVILPLLIGIAVLPTMARQNPKEMSIQGDKSWEDGSYEEAADAYQKALSADPNIPNHEEIEYRIAVSLERASKWDAAEAAFDAYVLKYKNTICEPRAQVWRGRLYTQIPHFGYKVGRKFFRGSDVPPSEGKDKPEYVDRSGQDQIAAEESLVRAKVLFYHFRSQKLEPAVRNSFLQEEMQDNFDLAVLFAQSGYADGGRDKNTDWKIDPALPFDNSWPVPKKVMYLYEQIPLLENQLISTDHHQSVLAAFGKAGYILQLRQQFQYYPFYNDYGGMQPQIRGGKIRPPRPPRPIPFNLPYLAIDPIKILQEALDRYPNDREADRLIYTIALWTEQKGDAVSALNWYGRLLHRFPKSRWASDAQQHYDEILRPSMTLSAAGMFRPGVPAVVSVQTRNIKQVRFTAYRVHLEDIFGKQTYEYNGSIARPQFSNFKRSLPFIYEHINKERDRIAEWTATTSDNGTHNQASDPITTPLNALGAYLVEARAGDRDSLGATQLVIVTDISLVQKIDRAASLIYAAESDSGRPIKGVHLTVWAPTRYQYQAPYPENIEKDAQYLMSETNGEGLSHQLLPVPSENANIPNRMAEVFAVAGPNRYALINNSQFNFYGIPLGDQLYKAFIQTDRPLYRPNQQVHIRVNLTHGTPGNYTPASVFPVRLQIHGPRGMLLEKTISTDANGTITDQFDLKTGADLGGYSIQILHQYPNNGTQYGQQEFRVEEYKKPEFTVDVQPEKSQIRVGEKARVVISAHFFFGAPVTKAKVHYRVLRQRFYYPMPFESRFSWFSDQNNGGQFGRSGFNRGIYNAPPEELSWWGDPNTAYKEGDIVTDEKGEAVVEFLTDPPKPPKGIIIPFGYRPDQSFTVTAKVVDDSRREVDGSGFVRASTTQFQAFMQMDRKFVLPGDPLKVEVRTVDANQKPVTAKGRVTFFRIIPAIKEERVFDPKVGKEVVVVKGVPAREEKEETLALETDAAKNGSGLLIWRPTTPANYRLQFDTKDAWGNDISTIGYVLVYGQTFDATLEKNDQRFEILPEFGEYTPHDIARMLIITPEPDSFVLLTEAAVGSIVRYRTIFVPGRSTIIDAPISTSHLPNAIFSATLARSGGVREVQAEVGVAAENQILSLKITPDRDNYKPGDRAVFTLSAADSHGRPVSGAITLGIVDESLFAMQPDLTQDIRQFFYGYRIQTQVMQSDSIYSTPGNQNFAPPIPSYEQHSLQYPEGLSWLWDHSSNGNIPAIPGYIPYTPRQFETEGYEILGRFGRGMGGMGGGGANRGDQYFGASRSLGVNGPMAADQLSVSNLSASARSGRVMSKASLMESTVSDSAALVPATVRKEFADTAFWIPEVTTDSNGQAKVSFTFPDNITKWRATARGITPDIKVGIITAQAVTKKNIMVRLQTPRFFVEKDQVTLSANVHNYLENSKHVRAEISLDAGTFTLDGPAVHELDLAKDGEARLDWTVTVKKPGKTKIRVTAQTDVESDAAELEFPVLVHGVEKFVAKSGTLRNGGEADIKMDLPAARRTGASLLDVQLSPSIGAMLLDALPYLEDYPYGCVEQTMSRFMPSVLVAQSLKNAGIDLETLGKRAKALEEAHKSIPPQQIYENSGYTYPRGIPGVLDAAELSSRLASSYHNRSHAPIFDSKTLAKMEADGLQRIAEMQRPDGSWGWWQGSSLGDPYLTAYIVEGLTHASLAGVQVNDEMLTRGLAYVLEHLESSENLNIQAYYSYVLSMRATPQSNDPRCAKVIDQLYARRDRLNAYARALLALSIFQSAHQADKRSAIIVHNLLTQAKIDREHATIHWESADPAYWHWYNDKLETTAMCLRAIVAIAPDLMVPADPKIAASKEFAAGPGTLKWLVDNRRGGHWTSTRQTANVIEALLEFATANKELTPDYSVIVDLDGKVRKSFHITAENALLTDNRFLVGDESLTSGGQNLHISMTGKGTLYYSSYLKYFDMSEPIVGVSNAIGVERKYYRLANTITKDKQGQSITKTERVPLLDGAQLTSGDIIEVELYLKSDNDYEYVVFEDMKPAGCEAVATQSGTAYGDGLCSNFELRDEKVAFFVDLLPQGTRRITYQLRAEIPGSFHALPTNGYAMYTPDIRALSDEWRAKIVDAPEKTIQTPAKKGQTK